MGSRHQWLAVTMVCLAAGCAAPPREVSADEKARAKEALAPLKKQLMGALLGALKEGGAEHAISACQVKAPEITAGAAPGGVEVGRTSHRLRNPKNAPEPWMEAYLKEYLSNPMDTEPRATRLGDGRVGYVEPIRLKGICLPCHGGKVEPAVQEKLRELYPEDLATGFKVGDFRGIFWVKLK